MKTYCNLDCGNQDCENNLNHLGTNETALYRQMRDDDCGFVEVEESDDGQSTT